MAQPSVPPAGFEDLSPDEKLDYIQALWDHFSEHPEDVPVPDWHREVVAERLAAHRRGEITSRPWSKSATNSWPGSAPPAECGRLEVSSEAELEIFEAAVRYERERVGLGVGFETQVNTAFARLVDNPFQFPVMEEGVRRAIVRIFPYGVGRAAQKVGQTPLGK